MTCIAAIKQDGVIYIGGDSAGVGPGYSFLTRADGKVFNKGGVVFGFSGSFRSGQLVRHGLKLPAQAKGQSDQEYLVIHLIDAIRKLCLAKGNLHKEDNVETSLGDFIVGYKGNIYMIESDLQVGEPKDNYAAIGCGSDIALGALYATKNLKGPGSDPIKRIELALSAASEYSAGVRGPFTIITDEKPAKKRTRK